MGLFLCFSCAVIRTIRTAFSLEAFKEQLQKQIVTVVAAVLVAEKKQNQEKAYNETKASPPPPLHLPGEGRCIFPAEAPDSQLHQEK